MEGTHNIPTGRWLKPGSLPCCPIWWNDELSQKEKLPGGSRSLKMCLLVGCNGSLSVLLIFWLTRGKMSLGIFLLPGGFPCPRLQATVTDNHGISPLKQWAKRSSPFNSFFWVLTAVAGDVLTHCPGSRWDCQSCYGVLGRASAFPLNCLSYQLAVADRACCWGPLWIHSSTAFN